MNFRAIFIAVTIATALILAAYLVNSRRPRVVVEQPSAAFVRASGKCAECHLNAQFSIVHEFEMSGHARKNVNCLDCHQVAQGQKGTNHHGFVINTGVTPANCRACHEGIYQQFLHSRHAAASWAAVAGNKDFTAEQIAFGEQFQPGGVKRAANPLTSLEGAAATKADAQAVTALANQTRMARSAIAQLAARVIRLRWNSPGFRARAGNAISDRIIRRWKSTPSRSMN